MNAAAHGTAAVQATLILPSAGSPEQAVIETATPHIWVSDPELQRSGETLRLAAKMVGPTDAPLVINRSDLEMTMMGAKELEQQIADGTATIEGDASVLAQLASTMVDFDPLFEILPGTAAEEVEVMASNAYEAVPGATIPE